MCGTCGCGEESSVSIRKPEEVHTHAHEHNHDHDNHSHDHTHHHAHAGHDHSHNKEIQLEVDILQKNNMLAERNRGYFEAKNILALNLVSSPGSGKTSLLEKTIREQKDKFDFNIVEGDQ